jgi:MoxR-like ATPase
MDRIELTSGKQVLASDPFKPEISMGKFAGQRRELEVVHTAWIWSSNYPPLSPLLIGDAGVGKNRIVDELHRETGLPLYIQQGHEDITAEDLACSVRFADGARNRMDYVLSPLVTAMYKGGICFIDEIGKIRPRALALLVSVLDERRYIDSSLLGERIKAADAFRFVAATNEGEERDLPEFLRSRMQPVIYVERPSEEDINRIIDSHYNLQQDRERLLEQFWELCRDQPTPTPREAIQTFALASSFASFELDCTSMRIESKNRPAITTEHVKKAYAELRSRRESGAG